MSMIRHDMKMIHSFTSNIQALVMKRGGSGLSVLSHYLFTHNQPLFLSVLPKVITWMLGCFSASS